MVSGGYLAVRATSLGVLTVCEHVVDVAPLTTWIARWSDAARSFGLEDAALPSARSWLERFQESVQPWHLAEDPSVPSAFLREFDLDGVVLGAATSKQTAQEVIEDWEDDGSTVGPIELLRAGQSPAVGELIGYDLLNIGYSGYEHSWRCFGFAAEEVSDAAFQLNTFGLLKTEAAAQRARRLLNDVAHTPPDGTWTCWAITRY
jgi:hypothetical protein